MKKSFIIIILGIILYCFSFSNGFVWDDEEILQQSPTLSRNANELMSHTYFRPVMVAVNSTLFSLFGPHPFFFHFFSVIFHIATAVLLFYLFKHFFKENLAFFLSLLFLVHPVNVEAVCFASAFQEVLFTFIGIIGLYLTVRSKNISAITIFMVTILSGVALLTKETGVVFFVLIFFYILLFHRKNMSAIQLFMAFAIITLFTYVMARYSSGNLYVQSEGLFPIMRVPLAVRLINIPLIILYYLTIFIFPLNLAIAQQWVVYSPGIISFFLPLIIEIALFSAAATYILKTKSKPFIFFFVWFLIGLLPHVQIVPLNMTVSERWMYFPQIGLLGMGALFLQHKIRHTKLVTALGIIIIILFSLRSFIRMLDWHSGLALYGSNITSTSNFDLQNNMGVELFRVGKYTQAKKYFEKSTRLAPYWWVNWNNLGASYEHEHNFVKAQECYEKSIQNGQFPLAYENLAKILVLRGTDKKKASEFVNKAVQLFPENETLQQLQRYQVNN